MDTWAACQSTCHSYIDILKVHHHQYRFALDVILSRAEPPSYSGYLPLYNHCEWKPVIASKAEVPTTFVGKYNVFLLSKHYFALLFAAMHRWRCATHLFQVWCCSVHLRKKLEYKNSIIDLTLKFKSFILRFHKHSWPSRAVKPRNCLCWENVQPRLDTVETSRLITSSDWAKLHCFLRISLHP